MSPLPYNDVDGSTAPYLGLGYGLFRRLGRRTASVPMFAFWHNETRYHDGNEKRRTRGGYVGILAIWRLVDTGAMAGG